MRRLLLLLVSGIWDIGKCVLAAVVCVLALVGALALADAVWPVKLPSIRPMNRFAGEKCGACPLAARQRTYDRESLRAMSNQQRWDEMSNALVMLDFVCPEVSAWVRNRYSTGRLFFETTERGRYAAFAIAPRILIINLSALEQCDTELACTLAHEFRHSKQPLILFAQCGIVRMFGVDRRKDLVEAQAYEWEDKIRRALTGQQPP